MFFSWAESLSVWTLLFWNSFFHCSGGRSFSGLAVDSDRVSFFCCTKAKLCALRHNMTLEDQQRQLIVQTDFLVSGYRSQTDKTNSLTNTFRWFATTQMCEVPWCRIQFKRMRFLPKCGEFFKPWRCRALHHSARHCKGFNEIDRNGHKRIRLNWPQTDWEQTYGTGIYHLVVILLLIISHGYP